MNVVLKLANDAKQYLVEVVQDSPTMKNIAIAATSAIIAAGATYSYMKNSTPPAPAPVTIINNGIMNQSGTVIITPEKAQEILEKVPKKQAAKMLSILLNQQSLIQNQKLK